MHETEYTSHYRIERAPFGSAAFQTHLTLTLSVYKKEGYLTTESAPAELIDGYDNSTAIYCLVRGPTDAIEGTFRVLTKPPFPFSRICPDIALPIDIVHFCETTRLASRKTKRSHHDRTPTEYIACEAVIESMCIIREQGCTGLLALVSPALHTSVNRLFQSIQRPLGNRRWYAGGYIVPTVIFLSEFEDMLEKSDPLLYLYYRTRAGF
ncbi:MAG: hypothetical protein AAB582_00840 [Patescibacteria group bacterium]